MKRFLMHGCLSSFITIHLAHPCILFLTGVGSAWAAAWARFLRSPNLHPMRGCEVAAGIRIITAHTRLEG